MGQPIQKKWFGLPVQIPVAGVRFADGTTSSSAYILEQKGSTAYIVQDIAQTRIPEIVFLVNATSTNNLLPGQCFITCTIPTASGIPVRKISQFRLTTYEPNNVTGSYTWVTGTNPQASFTTDTSIYLTDGSGNNLTDGAGNFLIFQ
jgi:hypothetical protein